MQKALPQTRKHQGKIIVVLSCLAVLFIALSVINLIEEEDEEPFDKQEAKYELTKTDIFAAKDFMGENVAVKGVMLGDTFDEVIEKIGYPDGQTEFPPDIKNIEYGKALGLESTGLIIHLRNNIVERITIKPPFNQYLIGKTVINHTKAEVYGMFGVPDDTQFLRISPQSILLYRVLSYGKYGLEITIRKNEMNGFSLVKSKPIINV